MLCVLCRKMEGEGNGKTKHPACTGCTVHTLLAPSLRNVTEVQSGAQGAPLPQTMRGTGSRPGGAEALLGTLLGASAQAAPSPGENCRLPLELPLGCQSQFKHNDKIWIVPGCRLAATCSSIEVSGICVSQKKICQHASCGSGVLRSAIRTTLCCYVDRADGCKVETVVLSQLSALCAGCLQSPLVGTKPV